MPKNPPYAAEEDDGLPPYSNEDSAHVLYYEETLDVALDASGEHLRAPFAQNAQRAWSELTPHRPSWWVNLWWRARWAVYALAFFTPLALFGALGALAWLLNGQNKALLPPTPAAAFAHITATPAPPALQPEWPPDVIFAPHTVPARIRDELAVPGARRGYQFQGRAGEVWTLAVVPLPDQTLSPELRFYGPDGKRICAAECPNDGEAQLVTLLAKNGLYRVVVQANDGVSTGLFLLTVAVE